MAVDGVTERGATRNDVARLAGVSAAVVSYVVNDGPRPVAEGTRERVLDAIAKLGYRPNAPARWLTTGRADLVALLVPDLQNPYFAALARAVEDAVQERGLGLVLVQTQGQPGGHCNEVIVDRVSGLMATGIISASLPTPVGMRALTALSTPVVVMSIAGAAGPFSSVWPDYEQGTRAAVRHLAVDHGHERIALVIGSTAEQQDQREQAYRSVLRELGLAEPVVVRTRWSMAGGREAASEVLAHQPRVTAVFAASDQQATGLLAGLYEAGVSVPGDLAVAAFDASPGAEFTVPPLTSAGSSMSVMATEAVDLLLRGTEATRIADPASLVIRRSCGCNAR